MVTKPYFSYIRVSTSRQGQTGTSLVEQEQAIAQYAKKQNLHIVKQFEEQQTAAKRGRPVFTQMLKALQQGKAQGVIIHKIDRSARNLKDWADIGELIDQGVEVHFAHESFDLHSRGGRLAADIQAVVAADYVRNLKEETKKGFYGRIKQGISPLPAPMGYLNRGKGNVKEPDPLQASLVKKAFELYATGEWGLNALVKKMYALGLRNRTGFKVSRNGLSVILHNPFYTGFIRIKKLDTLFPGKHQPLISKALYDQVQLVLQGKNLKKKHQHDFAFRKLVTCSLCQKLLYGEIHKGHIYYRCHNPACPQKSIRQEIIESVVVNMLKQIVIPEAVKVACRDQLNQKYQEMVAANTEQARVIHMQIAHTKNNLLNATNIYFQGAVDYQSYLDQKHQLGVLDQKLASKLEHLKAGEQGFLLKIERFYYLLQHLPTHHSFLPLQHKKILYQLLFKWLMVCDREVYVELHLPFNLITNSAG